MAIDFGVIGEPALCLLFIRKLDLKPLLSVTKNFLMVQAPRFIRGINPKSIFENPQERAFIRGVNLKSKI
ncbi:hypothetical protein [Microcoleus sp. AR_TQ3_B6]|uniref:hypothetical protein n=1 Tax=Microcoleus sp. AR_TQ3_B6 TaxID=3055284 RepID=UPI002FD5BF37